MSESSLDVPNLSEDDINNDNDKVKKSSNEILSYIYDKFGLVWIYISIASFIIASICFLIYIRKDNDRARLGAIISFIPNFINMIILGVSVHLS